MVRDELIKWLLGGLGIGGGMVLFPAILSGIYQAFRDVFNYHAPLMYTLSIDGLLELGHRGLKNIRVFAKQHRTTTHIVYPGVVAFWSSALLLVFCLKVGQGEDFIDIWLELEIIGGISGIEGAILGSLVGRNGAERTGIGVGTGVGVSMLYIIMYYIAVVGSIDG